MPNKTNQTINLSLDNGEEIKIEQGHIYQIKIPNNIKASYFHLTRIDIKNQKIVLTRLFTVGENLSNQPLENSILKLQVGKHSKKFRFDKKNYFSQIIYTKDKNNNWEFFKFKNWNDTKTNNPNESYNLANLKFKEVTLVKKTYNIFKNKLEKLEEILNQSQYQFDFNVLCPCYENLNQAIEVTIANNEKYMIVEKEIYKISPNINFKKWHLYFYTKKVDKTNGIIIFTRIYTRKINTQFDIETLSFPYTADNNRVDLLFFNPKTHWYELIFTWNESQWISERKIKCNDFNIKKCNFLFSNSLIQTITISCKNIKDQEEFDKFLKIIHEKDKQIPITNAWEHILCSTNNQEQTNRLLYKILPLSLSPALVNQKQTNITLPEIIIPTENSKINQNEEKFKKEKEIIKSLEQNQPLDLSNWQINSIATQTLPFKKRKFDIEK